MYLPSQFQGNPQWKAFDHGVKAVAVFHGPQTYVTPSWYKDADNVPTWNYAVVHIYGAPKTVDAAGTTEILRKTVNHFESKEPRPWSMEGLPADFLDGLVRGSTRTDEMSRGVLDLMLMKT